MFALGAGSLAMPLASFAQQRPKIWRIGFLNSGSPASAGHNLDALRQGLRELGYVEGQNLVIERRWAEGQMERGPRLADELVQIKVDVIVTGSLLLAQAARRATATIPIVMASGADPVAAGLAASLARPGGNVTGLTNLSTETTAKLVELAWEVVPKAARIAVLVSDGPAAPGYWTDAQKAGKALKVTLVAARANIPAEIDAAFATMAKERVSALVVPADTFFLSQRRKIIELAATAKLPTVCPRREYAEDGGLIGYGQSLPDVYRRAAIHVDKILKGAKPGDLPIEQPTRFELVINMKTAKALGLKIPNSILVRATKVIE